MWDQNCISNVPRPILEHLDSRIMNSNNKISTFDANAAVGEMQRSEGVAFKTGNWTAHLCRLLLPPSLIGSAEFLLSEDPLPNRSCCFQKPN